MRIIDKDNKQVYLSEIEDAGCFFDMESSTYNIKLTSENEDGNIGIVNLGDGELYYEDPKTKVVAIVATISIESEL